MPIVKDGMELKRQESNLSGDADQSSIKGGEEALSPQPNFNTGADSELMTLMEVNRAEDASASNADQINRILDNSDDGVEPKDKSKMDNTFEKEDDMEMQKGVHKVFTGETNE